MARKEVGRNDASTGKGGERVGYEVPCLVLSENKGRNACRFHEIF